MRRMLGSMVALLALVSVAEAQQKAPICTQSRNTKLVRKGIIFTPADSGTSASWYVSQDSVAENCVRLARALPKPVTPPPPPPDTTPTPPPPPDTTPTPPPPPPGSGITHPFFSSTEAGCGSDANVLWCDDFERGKWFVTYQSTSPTPLNAGWNGTPYGSADPQGKSFGRCGGMGVAGTGCAATNGGHTGVGQARAMADHDLSAATSELYFRYYVKPLPGYAFGQEKALTFNKGPAGVGGIFFGTLFFGSGDASSSVAPHFYAVNQGVNLGQNQGSFAMTGGNWYFIELHLKLNGAGSDVVEMWMDNCGATGTGCTGTPTLRMRYTNATLRPGGDNSSTFRSIWLENWANPAAVGEMLYDQIKASKVGPIGFKP